jgi:mRNA interferase RelE/StbE
MRVELSEKFLRELKKINKQDQERIMKTVERLEDPFSMDIRKVKSTKDIYRVKAGKWRIFIKINFEKKVVYVLKFDWRERAYDRI